MEDLDATVELGPSLELRLQHDADSSLWLELPLRVGYTLGSSIAPIGLSFHPRLAWRRPASVKYGWKLRLDGGPLYSDSEFHGYFYNVAADEARPDRPEFEAKSGFSGMRYGFSFSRRIERWWLGGFMRFDDLSDSEIEASPLVNDRRNFSLGLSLAYVLSEN